MKNLFKSVSGGDSAKFIYKGEVLGSDLEGSTDVTEAAPVFKKVIADLDAAFVDAGNSEKRVGQKTKALHNKLLELYKKAGVDISDEDMVKWMKDLSRKYVKNVKKSEEIANMQKDAILNYMRNNDDYTEDNGEKKEPAVKQEKEEEKKVDIKIEVEQKEVVTPELSIKEANDKVLASLTGKYLDFANASLSVDFAELGIEGDNSIDKNGRSNLTEQFQIKAGIGVDGAHGRESKSAIRSIKRIMRGGATAEEAFAEFKSGRQYEKAFNEFEAKKDSFVKRINEVRKSIKFNKYSNEAVKILKKHEEEGTPYAERVKDFDNILNRANKAAASFKENKNKSVKKVDEKKEVVKRGEEELSNSVKEKKNSFEVKEIDAASYYKTLKPFVEKFISNSDIDYDGADVTGRHRHINYILDASRREGFDWNLTKEELSGEEQISDAKKNEINQVLVNLDEYYEKNKTTDIDNIGTRFNSSVPAYWER